MKLGSYSVSSMCNLLAVKGGVCGHAGGAEVRTAATRHLHCRVPGQVPDSAGLGDGCACLLGAGSERGLLGSEIEGRTPCLGSSGEMGSSA